MGRRWVVVCVAAVAFGGPARADDRRGASPVATATPAAPTRVPARASDPTGAARTTPGPMPAPPLAASAAQSSPSGVSTPRDPIDRLRCEPPAPRARGWISADYLLWTVQSSGTPPLVVADVPGTPRAAVGGPSTPGQQVLFGGSGLNGDLRSGFRIDAGFWLGACRRWAISADFFLLESENEGGTFSSTGNPPLSRPFFNVLTGRPDAELVAFPGVLSGSVTVDARNTFGGAGAFLQGNLCALDPCDPCDPCTTGYRLDFRAGYRRFELNDTLQVREDLLTVSQQMQVPPGTRIVVNDRFRTENTFDGGLLGLTGDVRRGRWSADFRTGVSLGNLNRVLTIEGSTAVAVPGQPPAARIGGLLAQRSNVGRYTSDTFTAIPEVGLNLGYQLTPGLRVHVGYTFIYLPNTWRAGDQIDRVVDPTQLAGIPSPFGRPAARLVSTGTAVQGLNVGLLLRY